MSKSTTSGGEKLAVSAQTPESKDTALVAPASAPKKKQPYPFWLGGTSVVRLQRRGVGVVIDAGSRDALGM